MYSLTELIIRRVDDKFAWIDYHGFQSVLIDLSNSYINASKLCKEDITSTTPNGKRFDQWLNRSSSKELMQELFIEINSTEDTEKPIPVVIQHTNVSNEVKGSYIHPLLVPNVLAWLSPRFSLQVGRIVNMYVAKQQEELIKKKYYETLETIQSTASARETRYRQRLNKLVDTYNNLTVQYNQLREEYFGIHNQHESIISAFDGLVISNVKVLKAIDTLKKITNPNNGSKILVINKLLVRITNNSLSDHGDVDTYLTHYVVVNSNCNNLESDTKAHVTEVLREISGNYTYTINPVYISSADKSVKDWSFLSQYISDNKLQLSKTLTLSTVLNQLREV